MCRSSAEPLVSALRHHSESRASGVRFLGQPCCALLGRVLSLCLRSASILKSSADTCVDVDTLAGFFPGVCAALVHLLLRGDFKLGSHVVVAVFGALRAWIARVKDQSRRLQDRRPERCYTSTQACTSFSTFCALFWVVHMGQARRCGGRWCRCAGASSN